MTTIRIDVSSPRWQDFDSVFDAVSDELAEERDLPGYDFGPRWENDDERDTVLVDVPRYAVFDTDEVV